MIPRNVRIRRAVLARISAWGDMPIPVSRHTLASLMIDLGFSDHAAAVRESEVQFREIDAAALEVLACLCGEPALVAA